MLITWRVCVTTMPLHLQGAEPVVAGATCTARMKMGVSGGWCQTSLLKFNRLKQSAIHGSYHYKHKYYSEPPERGRKIGASAKIVKKYRKYF